MGALGACALPIALAGGAPLGSDRRALMASLVLGVHAALAVPLVRTELRPRERAMSRRAELAGLVALGALAAALVASGHALLSLALLPRGLQIATRPLGLPTPRRPSRIGIAETALLAACAVIIVVAG
jgi:hypothetical protein